jgi:L-ascorbate metabolism protein UlaG (beta-lactamase superfamily)
MRVEYVTHASLLVTTARGRLLTDPYFRLDPWDTAVATLFPPRRVDIKALAPLRWVFISHEHSDHAHPPTLRALRKAGILPTLLIPARRPGLRSLLEREGFTDLVELPHLKPVELAAGVSAMAVLHPNGVDSTLVFRAQGKAVAACSDCFLPPDLALAATQRGPLDVAFVPHTSAQDLYPFVLDLPLPRLKQLATEREAEERARLLVHAAVLNARLTVPYAFALAYHHPDQQHLNEDGHTLPEDFVSALALHSPEQHAVAMWPGDSLDVGKARVTQRRRPPGMDGTREGFFSAVAAHFRKHPPAAWNHGNADEAAPWVLRHFTRRALSSPWLAVLKDRVIHLRLLAGDGDVTWTLPVGGEGAVEGAQGQPVLVINMPACLVEPLLDGSHDPFMALYSYRVRFSWREALLPTERAAADAAVDLFVRLFTPRKMWL